MKYLTLSALLALSQSVLAALAPASSPAPENPDCPKGIIPTPSYGTKGGIFSVCTVIDINAPQENIYNIVKNFDGYPRWNSFVVKVDKTSEGPYRLNSTMTFNNANIFPLTTFPSTEKVSVWDQAVTNAAGFKELHVAWAVDNSTIPPLVLAAEHLTIVRDLKNGTNRVVSFETYYGAIAPVVELATGAQLRKNFPQQNQDLKKWAEAGNSS